MKNWLAWSCIACLELPGVAQRCPALPRDAQIHTKLLDLEGHEEHMEPFHTFTLFLCFPDALKLVSLMLYDFDCF